MYDKYDLYKLTDWRNNQYFEERLDHYFLFDTGFRLVVGKLTPPSDKNAYYWFVYPAFHLKAVTTRCVSLKDVTGTLVEHVDSNLMKGKLGEFGVLNQPYVYVYWTHTPMKDTNNKPLGMPVALPDFRELKLVTPPLLNLN
jgi:hypothetical protein